MKRKRLRNYRLTGRNKVIWTYVGLKGEKRQRVRIRGGQEINEGEVALGGGSEEVATEWQ